jgi:hypothetical protein
MQSQLKGDEEVEVHSTDGASDSYSRYDVGQWGGFNKGLEQPHYLLERAHFFHSVEGPLCLLTMHVNRINEPPQAVHLFTL